MFVNTRTFLFLAAVCLCLCGSTHATTLLFEDFESPVVTGNTQTRSAGWDRFGGGNYNGLYNVGDTGAFTPASGNQVFSCYYSTAFGYQYVISNSSILSDTVQVGQAYNVSFNVGSADADPGEYYMALVAVDDLGTETVLGSVTGSSATNDLTSVDSLVSFDVTATGNEGERLAIKFSMANPYTRYQNSPIFDNVTLQAVPEPSAFLMGLIGISLLLRRRR